MNYLAHIYLSGKNRQIQIGNFVGDAVKGKAYNSYPDFFRKGILLHRLIDSFADTHPAVKEAVSLGKPLFGRYSAAVTDIFFDHFLALGFPQYTGQKTYSLCPQILYSPDRKLPLPSSPLPTFHLAFHPD